MKKDILKLGALSLAASIFLVGCGSSTDNTEVISKSTFSGTVIDPEIQGANVFLDQNENGIYDIGELKTTTDINGTYSLEIPDSSMGKPIVITGGTDKVTKKSFTDSLSAITNSSNTSQNITPLTTIVHKSKKLNSSKSLDDVKIELSTKLGINVDDFDKNTVKSGNENLLKVALRIQKIAKHIKDNNGKNEDISKVYETLVSKLTTDANLSDAINSTITSELDEGSLALSKAEDLDLELRNLDESLFSDSEQFALTVENINDNIYNAKSKTELETNLYDDDTIKITSEAEVKTAQGERTLESLGLGDLDQVTKDKIIDNNQFDVNEDIETLKDKVNNNQIGLDSNTTKAIKTEQLFNDNGLKDLDKDTKNQLKEKLDNDNFDFENSSKDDLKDKLNDNNFIGNDEGLKSKIDAQKNKVEFQDDMLDGKNIVGSIIKGPIDGATIKLKDASGEVISSTISTKGIFVIPEQTLSSTFYTIESSGGRYEDEASKNIVDMNDSQGLKTYLTKAQLQDIITNKKYIAITPETTIYTDLIKSGLDANTSKALITSAMITNSSPMPNLEGDIFLQTGNFTSAFPSNASESFARNRAVSFSYMIRDLNLSASSVFNVINLIVEDYKDGKADGITINSKDINISEEFSLSRTKLFQDTTSKLRNGELSNSQKAQLKEMGFDVEQFDNSAKSDDSNLTALVAKYTNSTTLPTLNILKVLNDEDGDINDTKASYTLTAMQDVNVTISTPDGNWTTPMWRYNNEQLPVVIKTSRGYDMNLTLNNQLDANSTIHWHGFKIPAHMDGGPDIPVSPNTTKSYTFKMQQQAAPLWFHPHPDMQTGKQVYMGLAGVYLLEDDISKSLELNKEIPSGAKDTVLLVQDRRFDGKIGDVKRDLLYKNIEMDNDGMLGDTILVNGSVVPKQSVSNTLHRYRLYNVSNARNYDFALSDGSDFTVIATDGGFLKNPVSVNHITLGAAQRVEIVIDFSKYEVGSKVLMVSKPFNGDMMGMMNMDSMNENNSSSTNSNMTNRQGMNGMGSGSQMGEMNNNSNTNTNNSSMTGMSRNGEALGIMRFDITSSENEDITLYSTIDSSAEISNRIDESTASNVGNEREFVMSMGAMGGSNSQMNFVINGKSFKANRVDELITKGDTEIWSIKNMSPMAHPFHAHAIQYQILTRNGVAASGIDLGWKDTFLVQPGETVRIIGKFDGVINYGDYMYHCHILEHEDAGMMGYFRIGETGNLDNVYGTGNVELPAE